MKAKLSETLDRPDHTFMTFVNHHSERISQNLLKTEE